MAPLSKNADSLSYLRRVTLASSWCSSSTFSWFSLQDRTALITTKDYLFGLWHAVQRLICSCYSWWSTKLSIWWIDQLLRCLRTGERFWKQCIQRAWSVHCSSGSSSSLWSPDWTKRQIETPIRTSSTQVKEDQCMTTIRRQLLITRATYSQLGMTT